MAASLRPAPVHVWFDCTPKDVMVIASAVARVERHVMIQRLCALLFTFFMVAAGAGAAPYPDHSDVYVNDLAKVLPADAVTRLRQDLIRLKTETGVQMTVLTIGSRQEYLASASIETFASGLFNAWGIGRAKYNDGILVLVAVQDHEMRLELGSGYDQGYDVLAQDLVDRWFLPSFRNDDYAKGIEAGVTETINRIARPHAKGLPADPVPFSIGRVFDRIVPYIFGLIVAAIVTFGLFGRYIGDWNYRFRRCPVCGQTGLHREHVMQGGTMTTLDPPPAPGSQGLIVTTCSHCNYRDSRPWRVDNSRSGGGGGSFGGGRSSGGGATGRW